MPLVAWVFNPDATDKQKKLAKDREEIPRLGEVRLLDPSDRRFDDQDKHMAGWKRAPWLDEPVRPS